MIASRNGPHLKTYQRYSANFTAKYGSLDLYDEDMKNTHNIDNEDIHYVKKEGMYLIGIPDEIDNTSTDHEYFSIHDEF